MQIFSSSETFPINIHDEMDDDFNIYINWHTWPQVKKKRLVKSTIKEIIELEYNIVEIEVSSHGTTYIFVTQKDTTYYARDKIYVNDDDEVWLEDFSIRISDHESAAGKFSFDGRTDSYTQAHYEPEKFDAAELQDELEYWFTQKDGWS